MKIREKIIQIIDQFKREELGNRLSQFSLKGLIQVVSDEFEKEDKGNNKKE